MNKQQHTPRQTIRYSLIGSSAIFLLLLTVLGACVQETNPNADSNVTAEEMAKQTDVVEGQSVTIRSGVQEKVGESSFTLSNLGESILVLNISGKPFMLPENDAMEIQATGKVAKFVLVDIEREYDLDLNPDVYAEYETQPVLLANSLALSPDPGTLTQNPEKFYNMPIVVEGEVEDVIDGTTFTLDEEKLFGATDLLVIGTPVTNALDGKTVTVTGQLRRFILTEFERDYDLTWDLDTKRKIEAEYSEKPVFVADSLYPKAE